MTSAFASSSPRFLAEAVPPFVFATTLTGGPNDSAIALVRSVEPSSTTITSRGGSVCPSTLSSVAGKVEAAL